MPTRQGGGATSRARRAAPNMPTEARARAQTAWENAVNAGASPAEAAQAGMRAATEGTRGNRRGRAAAQRAVQAAQLDQARSAFARARRQGMTPVQARAAARRILPGATVAQLNTPRRRGR